MEEQTTQKMVKNLDRLVLAIDRAVAERWQKSSAHSSWTMRNSDKIWATGHLKGYDKIHILLPLLGVYHSLLLPQLATSHVIRQTFQWRVICILTCKLFWLLHCPCTELMDKLKSPAESCSLRNYDERLLRNQPLFSLLPNFCEQLFYFSHFIGQNRFCIAASRFKVDDVDGLVAGYQNIGGADIAVQDIPPVYFLICLSHFIFDRCADVILRQRCGLLLSADILDEITLRSSIIIAWQKATLPTAMNVGMQIPHNSWSLR